MSELITHRDVRVELPLENSCCGLIIWAKDFMALGQPPRNEYRVSFAVAFHENTPMESGFFVSDNGILPISPDACRVYDGQQTEPDPLIAEDTGQRVAFTGTKYVVFEDLLLTPFNNAIPAIYFGKTQK